MIKNIPVSKIYVPNVRFPENVKYDPSYQKLLNSVREKGVLAVLTVMPYTKNGYWLLDGRYRLAAAIELKHKKIRCSIVNLQ